MKKIYIAKFVTYSEGYYDNRGEYNPNRFRYDSGVLFQEANSINEAWELMKAHINYEYEGIEIHVYKPRLINQIEREIYYNNNIFINNKSFHLMELKFD